MRDRPGSAVTAARALEPTVSAYADRAERERTLPAELVAALNEAGLFRVCVPAELGGAEVHPAELVAAVEEVARVDASAGWCAMIGATTGVVSGYLEADTAREIYGTATVTGGVYAPSGRAVAVDGGYRVSGRWAYASGCLHCDWLMGGSLVPDSPPRLLIFPRQAVTIHDTWSVAGLCGTGSHDIEVAELFVPARRSISLTTDRPRQGGALYAFPVFGLLAIGISAVALGIARGAVDDLIDLAGAKTPTGSRRKLAERPLTQMELARAETELRAARALVMEAIEECWEQASCDGEIQLQQRARLRAAATNATAESARVVDAMYTLGGGTAVYRTSPLQRRFRDVHAATQHMMVAPPTWEVVGRVLLGIDTDTSAL